MSPGTARHIEQITGSRTASATACTASKSPLLLAAKPASIISTPSRSSWRAICTFSIMFRLTPGVCSPSRSVVSKNTTLSAIIFLPRERSPAPLYQFHLSTDSSSTAPYLSGAEYSLSRSSTRSASSRPYIVG